MSLNQICGYDADNISSHIDMRVNNVFISDNLNIRMTDANPGDQLIIQPGGAIGWEPAEAVANEALEHFQTSFNQLIPLTNTNFTQLGVLAPPIIPDPLGNISVAADVIEIRYRLRAIFMMIVKFAVNVDSEGSCYEFKMERKFAPNAGAGDWADYGQYCRMTTTVLNHDIYNTQTLCCQFPLDTYGTGIDNTYLRFMYKKVEPTSPDVIFSSQASSITMIRLV